MRGRPKENIEIKRKFTKTYYDIPSKPELGGKSVWHYNLDVFPNGPILVEHFDPEFNKLEKLYNKLERLKEPKYHENGRKKRTTKADKIALENAEKKYWAEHYKLFPEDRPKKRGRRRTNRTNS